MNSPQRNAKGLFVVNGDGHRTEKKYTCDVCGKSFRSKSHFDSICNLCWADNEMRPYITLGRIRRPGTTH
jgi:hypothetical protein